MFQKHIAQVAASIEIIVGITLIIVPDLVAQLLFGSALIGNGVPITRIAGIGLLSLGIACLSTRGSATSPRAILGLLTYNSGAAILFTYVGLATPAGGILLWPAAILHAFIAAALLPRVLGKHSVRA
jgi:hypothetical protein